jgi:chemotaxis family two-component system response regulator Rcp1
LLQILLVEDNPGDVRLLKEAFQEFKTAHKLHTAVNGEEALDFIFRRHNHTDKPLPDLILLDINLPTMNGHQVLNAVKKAPQLKRIPVVMLTSSNSDADVNKAYDEYANAYVQKPSNLNDFFDLVGIIERFWFGAVRLPQKTS